MNLLELIDFYKYSIARYHKIGIGEFTEYKIPITEQLIATLTRRLQILESRRFVNTIANRFHVN